MAKCKALTGSAVKGLMQRVRKLRYRMSCLLCRKTADMETVTNLNNLVIVHVSNLQVTFSPLLFNEIDFILFDSTPECMFVYPVIEKVKGQRQIAMKPQPANVTLTSGVSRHLYSYYVGLLQLDNIRVMVIVWRLRGNTIRTALCWIVWHNVHSQQHTYVSSSYRSNRLGLSHWDPYAVRGGGCLELYYCNMVEWFWCDPDLDDQLVSFSALTLWVWSSCLKNRPRNDYYVSSGTLNPTHITAATVLFIQQVASFAWKQTSIPFSPNTFSNCGKNESTKAFSVILVLTYHFFNFLTFGHSGAQSRPPECPNVKKLKRVG